MVKDITFGQYYPSKSALHNMDARMKLVLTFAMIVCIFLCHNFFSLGVMALFTVIAVIFSRVPV
ncbi:MAG: energy-coupling factor transporter transmembrane protein EcfT, partial [Clostridia bacterium]|nr:energy-coupling factor transporter transmembrane protein EcfT [Clostridia bacterium]